MCVYTMVAERENYFQCLQLKPVKVPGSMAHISSMCPLCRTGIYLVCD